MPFIQAFSDNHFELDEREIALFRQFLDLFVEYNSHTNLSAIRDPALIIEKHFVDSLYGSIPCELHGKLLDIGSGWGFPGIPLQIVYPELQVTLLDSVGKKTKAMNHFIHELWLTQATVIRARAETLAKDKLHKGKYDFITSRATAYITDILKWSIPFLAPHGKIILYKMPFEDEEKDLERALRRFHLVIDQRLDYILADRKRTILVLGRDASHLH